MKRSLGGLWGVDIEQGKFTAEKSTVATVEFGRDSMRSRQEVKGQNFGLQKLDPIVLFWFS